MVSSLILNKPQDVVEEVCRTPIPLFAAGRVPIEVSVLAISCTFGCGGGIVITALGRGDLDMFVQAIVFGECCENPVEGLR